MRAVVEESELILVLLSSEVLCALLCGGIFEP